MTRLFLTLFLCLIGSKTQALTEILEASQNGNTHVDPISMTATINYSSQFPGTPHVSYARCRLDSSGNPVNNYFIVKRLNAQGVLENSYLVQPGSSCEEIQRNDTGIAHCEAHSALELTISDPTQCAQNQCTPLATPRQGTMSIPLSSPTTASSSTPSLQSEIQRCSPQRQLVLIRDASGKSMVVSLADKAHCGLERRRITTEGAAWDDNESPLTQIFTSNRNGFYIGNHTHYFFDQQRQSWCVHFRPDIPSTAPSCGLNNLTRSIAFLIPSQDRKVQKGVVRLSIDANGNPVAIVGHPRSTEYSVSPELDESRPLLRMTLTHQAQEGRRTLFESMSSLNGNVLRRVDVAPQYVFGNTNNEIGSCDSTACLSAPSPVLAQDSALQCQRNNQQSFATPGNGRDVCYSCNGVTSGRCTSDKVVLNSSNIAEMSQRVTNCRSSAVPVPADDATPATSAQ